MDANHGIMNEEDESLGSFSSLMENSGGSSSSSPDIIEDTASSGSSSSFSSSPTSSCKGPLFEMSCLREQLPFKRGLSKHYQGKSQSFTSFSSINCLEDLVKPGRSLKKLKSSKSCGEGMGNKESLPLRCCNKRTITKKASKGCFSTSGSARRKSFWGSKPPPYPHRPSSNLSDQTHWFA